MIEAEAQTARRIAAAELLEFGEHLESQSGATAFSADQVLGEWLPDDSRGVTAPPPPR